VTNDSWSAEKSAQLYAVKHWGDNYFSVNAAGHVCVTPKTGCTTSIDLFEIASQLQDKALSFPVLLRFTDILRDRIEQLQQAFSHSCQLNEYHGVYTPVYPIKVNQQGTVVENIVAANNIGLEAGSKPELLAILGLSRRGVIVCNGYKDRSYIRLALIGQQMGQEVFIVIEKTSELDLIFSEAAKLNVRPQIGIRVRLSSISAGKWQNSGGEKSKFGLHANEVLNLIDRLKANNMLDCLQLMHFHMGSQIANIHDIKLALKEASQFYLQLRQLGANITIVDAGGGLGVDYDGSSSRRESSINYSLDEYADNIVKCFADICNIHDLQHPHIFTESGRAITAHHAVLITNVTEIESLQPSTDFSKETITRKNIIETYHNVHFEIAEARTLFAQGDISLNELAEAEQHYINACYIIKDLLNTDNHNQRQIKLELDEKLADKIFCNFSLFQSMPDIWGIDQIFPIMPIHRLEEKPTRRAVIQDLTCDSDGRIDHYVDNQNIEATLPIHPIDANQPYLLGFFMLGAYQEILGDMHNLFGDTHSLNIELNENGYHINDFLEGEHVSDLFEYVHINIDSLKSTYHEKLQQSHLSEEQRVSYLQELNNGLKQYTYLEK
jgi:arginine decarboxylase